MVLRYLGVVGDSPLAFVVLLAAFIFSMLVSLAFHEFSHAYVANQLGDRTPAMFGRLTLNPRAHLDPVGSLMILFVGFGWAKPVPVNPFATANPKRNMALIAGAGPLSNLVMAGLAGIPIKTGAVPFFHPFVQPALAGRWAEIWTESPTHLLGLFLGTVVFINVLLAVFNFIPLAPLDGFRVAVGVLPNELARPLAELERWGPGILMVLILLPFISGGQYSPLFDIMRPFYEFFLDLFAGDAGIVRQN